MGTDINKVDVSIIIVNYNTKDLLKRCLEAIQNNTKINYEIIVVDNNSKDDSIASIRDMGAKILELKENIGFAGANNAGFKVSRGRYVLLLNPDVIIETDVIDSTFKFLNNSKYSVLGCRLMLPNGQIDHGCRRKLPDIRNSVGYFMGKVIPSKIVKDQNYARVEGSIYDTYGIECISGAYMLIRREIYEKLNGLDEAFFMYGEDIDFCYRVKALGEKIIYKGDSYAVHLRGQSSFSEKKKNRRSRKTIYEFYRAMDIYYRKHFMDKTNPLVNYTVISGIWLKYYYALSRNYLIGQKK